MLPRPMFLWEAELCSCGAGVLMAQAPRDGWNAGADSPAAVMAPAQPRTDKAIHTKKFTKSRENTGTITSLKKVSCCCRHKTQKQKTHLKLSRPHPKTFQHVPHYLKRSPYGLDSKVHGGGMSRILRLARLSGKSGRRLEGSCPLRHLCAPRRGLSTELGIDSQWLWAERLGFLV